MKLSVTFGKASQCKISNFYHNAREHKHPPKYLLPDEARVYAFMNNSHTAYTRSGDESVEQLEREFSERSEIYKKRTGKTVSKLTRKHLSIIIGVSDCDLMKENPNTKISDAAEKLCELLGTEPIQTAVHLDEGYVNGEGETIYNHHIHVEICNLDKNGNSINKRLNKGFLSRIQRECCRAAGAEYKKFTAETRRKNIPHNEYRIKARAERERNEALSREMSTQKNADAKMAKAKEIIKANEAYKASLEEEKAEIKIERYNLNVLRCELQAKEKELSKKTHELEIMSKDFNKAIDRANAEAERYARDAETEKEKRLWLETREWAKQQQAEYDRFFNQKTEPERKKNPTYYTDKTNRSNDPSPSM